MSWILVVFAYIQCVPEFNVMRVPGEDPVHIRSGENKKKNPSS